MSNLIDRNREYMLENPDMLSIDKFPEIRENNVAYTRDALSILKCPLPSELKSICKRMGFETLQGLVKRVPSMKDSDAIRVTELLLSYGFGKPREMPEANVSSEKLTIEYVKRRPVEEEN